MKSIYYLITAGSVIDDSTVIYQTAIGSGAQDTRDFLQLTAFAADFGWFFHVRDMNTTAFVLRIMRHYSLPQASMVKCSARTLVRNIKAQLAQPLAAESLHQQHVMRQFLNANYRFLSNLNRENSEK